MRSHVNLLGILHLVWGAMGLLLAVSLMVLATGAGAIARTSVDEPLTAWFTAALFVLFAAALAAAGWSNAWAGRALRRHRSTGRLAALGLAALNVFILPFGTALAIYGFWVLLNNDARRLFEPQPAR
jgi:NADH:ubiquinone oxidoreductase subunit 6 (subunit J)